MGVVRVFRLSQRPVVFSHPGLPKADGRWCDATCVSIVIPALYIYLYMFLSICLIIPRSSPSTLGGVSKNQTNDFGQEQALLSFL
jgi:hypothetical protein